MKFKFLIIPSVLIFQVAGAQNGSSTVTPSQAPGNVTVSTTPATTESQQNSSGGSAETSATTETLIVDYKSVFEAATLEEEVKMATERFGLTATQQDVWSVAAVDRRATEKQAREKLDAKGANYEKEGVYRGLRASQNNFHETITGYLTPTQKQQLETDRMILEEKRKRLAKLPPPPPPAPTVTVAPVDSAAIKAEQKGKGKKAKKKKKAVAQ